MSVLETIEAGYPYLIAAFLLGSLPFGVVLSRTVFKSDIRASGSGNIGAANALRTYGKGAGAAVLVLDALKGLCSVEVARAAPPSVANALVPLAALAAIAGHCYSPWLGFRGGKGVATYLGCVIGFGPIAPLLFVAAWALAVARTGIASVASIAAVGIVTVWLIVHAWGRSDLAEYACFAVGALALVVVRHGENIARIRAGTERRLAGPR